MTVAVAEVPVLIVGGGPAGLTASLLLSRHGIQSLLADKRAAESPLPRARGVHARAMEILRVCGVEPDLRAVELPITPGAEWRARMTGAPLREDVLKAGPGISPCEGLSVSQDVFESVLREHARSYASAQLLAGTRLTSSEVSDDGVDAALLSQETGRCSRIRARWLIAADGARSGIRRHLDIALNGPDDLGRQQMIAFRADLTAYTGEHPRGIYFLTDTRAALIWTHRGHRWVLSIPDRCDGTDVPDPATTVRDVLGIPGLPVDVLGSNHWTAAAQSAARYRHGPVFLAGDAAHRFPPAGATGVSTAMHDAHNLAWKIAAVHHGHAGPDLLDSYRAEREPVGQRNAGETGTAWSRLTTTNAVPFAGRSLTQIDMGYQYVSPVITGDGSPGADPPGADYTPSAAPGCRAPHQWIRTGRGRRSTIDLFDRAFVLLTAGPGTSWRAAAEAASDMLRLPVDSHVIREPGWPRLYGVTPGGAVLVRPDGHVAWRSRRTPGSADPAAQTQILAALAAATGTPMTSRERAAPRSDVPIPARDLRTRSTRDADPAQCHAHGPNLEERYHSSDRQYARCSAENLPD
jgi:putative polyketide hydroxylase